MRTADITAAAWVGVLVAQTAATLEASFPPAANCTFMPNMDCQGGEDVAHMDTPDAASCCGQCEANARCTAFTWNGETCYMKNACSKLNPIGPPNVAGVMHKAPVNPNPCIGPLSMTVGGAPKTIGVMQDAGNSGTSKTDGAAFTLYHGGLKVHATETCGDHFTPGNFFFLKLLGKTLSYTVDLSNVSCGCNAAVYLTSMPGMQNATTPAAASDFYCDANCADGQPCCPEIDLMEANAHVSAATLHKCTFPYWDNPACDGGGYAQSTRDSATGVADFGPGGHKVDTAKPFRASHTFATDGKSLTGMQTSFVQAGGKGTVWLNHTDAGYMASMDFAVKNPMVLTISLWGGAGGTMGWLDSPPCDATIACDPSAHATWQDFEIG